MLESIISLPPSLLNILGAFASLTPTKYIVFPQDLTFAEIHNFLLKFILLNSHFQQYPPASQYQTSFWKSAVEHVEAITDSENDEIDSQIYDHYVDLMSMTSTQTVGSAPPSPSYVTYFWTTSDGVSHSATLLESRTTIEGGTTGLKTWPASLTLANYLITHSDVIQNKRILELGCGIGLLGVIAATLQIPASPEKPQDAQSAICLTDVRIDVLERCQSNLDLPCNGSSRHPNISTRLLDWSDALNPSGQNELQQVLTAMSPDLILGADVVRLRSSGHPIPCSHLIYDIKATHVRAPKPGSFNCLDYS
ncbi:unnamed protein product [Somion occarium]|uniref:Uncharacterized protein n=1 Tax=Somion occarium TaxID=3059160 RepID=A0ABP1CIT1_9APHY